MRDPLNTVFDEQPEEDTVEAPSEQPEEAESASPEPLDAAPEPDASDAGKGEPAAPPAASEERQQSIPITALLDERDKRKRLEQEATTLRARLQEIEARNAPKPDFYDDPQAALMHQQQHFQQLLAADRVQRSHFMAVQEHGPEFVQEVIDFFNDPKHMPKSHEFLGHPFPMQEAIRYYRQQRAVAEIGEDPAAYRERIRQELLAEMQQAPAGIAPTKPQTPPRSMATAPASGATTSRAAGSAFDAVFPE